MSTRDAPFRDVSGILEPASVAVVGASDRPGNLGGDTVRRLVRFGFRGPIWPVHPGGRSLDGLECYSRVSELPGVPDLAILAVPAETLHAAVEECAAHGVRFGIAYAGGLAEAGGRGREVQDRLTRACRGNGFMLCGPNCVGVINATLPATSTFSTALFEMDSLRAGNVSILAQSGGIATTALAMIQKAGFGTRHMISSGNEAVVDFSDYLYALAADGNTHVIAGYLEGVRDGPKFVRALEAARDHATPVVLIKAGTTGASASAAEAHTGALVGEDRVFDALFRELGVVRVSSLEELVDVSLTLVGTRPSHGPLRRVAIVTFGGGNGVLAADQCAARGLEAPPLGAGTLEALVPLLAPVATAGNPMDLTPTTAFREESLARLPEALDVVARDSAIDSVLLIAGSLASRAREISDAMLGLIGRRGKPVFVCWPSPPRGVLERFAAADVFVFLEPDRAIRAIARLEARFASGRGRQRSTTPGLVRFDWDSHVAATGSPQVVPEPDCHRILAAAGLAVAAGRLVRTEADAIQAAGSMASPAALKGISRQVTHRGRAGLVRLGLENPDQVRQAFRSIHANAGAASVTLEGVYVQAMHPGEFEILVSAFKDPLFGTMVTCGAGGAWTEAIDDVVTERAPVSPEVAAGMLERVRVFGRGTDIGDRTGAAAGFLARFSELAATAPWDRFVLEINPVMITSDGPVAVDGLLVVDAVPPVG